MADLDGRAHALQGLQVQVHGPGPDGAAAGEAHGRPAEAGEEGAEDQDGGPHGLHEVVGGLGVLAARTGQLGLQLETLALGLEAGLGAQGLEHLHHGADVGHRREVREHHRLRGEQGRRQAGQGRVLRPGHPDAPLQGKATLDHQSVHRNSRASA